MSPRFRLLLPALLALFVVFACEDEDDSPSNQAPTLASASYETDEMTPLLFALDPHDAEQDPVVIDVVEQPQNGSIEGVQPPPFSSEPGQWFRYEPESGFTGEDTAWLQLWDGSDSSAVIGLLFTVHPVNTEEAAVLLGENLALHSGGLLEDLEVISSLAFVPTGPGPQPKGDRVDDVSFDPETCIWSVGQSRHNHAVIEGDTLSFNYDEDWDIWMRDEIDSCVVFAGPDLVWLDKQHHFEGETRNRRFQGSKSGYSDLWIGDFNDGVPGIRANGSITREGQGQVLRREDWIGFQFELSFDLSHVVTIQHLGRRLPVSGQVAFHLQATRDGMSYSREGVIDFGNPAGGDGDGEEGRIRFDDGEEWVFDTFTGSVNNLQ